MLAAALAALVALVAIGPLAIPGPIGPWLVAIPDEPGAEVLVEGAIYQAVAADLDADGARDIVVLTHGEGSAITASAWRETDAGWRRIGRPLEVVPGAAIPGVAWLGTPARLLVRSVGGRDRVTLVRQPAYRDPDADAGCCLLVDDLVVDAGGLRLVQAAPTRNSVEAVLVVDLDADGTDELVATRSVPPLGDISYPTDAFVFRWTEPRFAITTTRLPIGSGDTPFLLGESDGLPGDELAINATLGFRTFYRLSLGAGDTIEVDDAGLVVDDALAVRVDGAPGLAVVTGGSMVSVRTWPAGSTPSEPVGEVQLLAPAELIGAVDVVGAPSLLVRQVVGGDRLHALGLPDLGPPRYGAVARSPVAAALSAADSVLPYVGTLPGGGPDGRPAVIYGGRLLGIDPPAGAPRSTGVEVGTLAGAQPIGLVGRERRLIALLHADEPLVPLDPAGGRLDAPDLQAAAAISVAPAELAWQPEAGDATLEPSIGGATVLGARRGIAVGPAGFTARLEAPAGSRVYASGRALSVPRTGVLDVALVPPATDPGLRYREHLTVTTPAGHSYLATWEVRLLNAPPPLVVTVATALGSGEVEVSGRTVPYAVVTVDGAEIALDADGRYRLTRPAPPWPTEIVVTAADPLGNVATRRVSAIGWLDYRGLPWIPIVAIGVALAGAVLYLRVPRVLPVTRRPDDDGVLEELEPD